MSSSGSSSTPFLARNTYVASRARRLLPSTSGWLPASECGGAPALATAGRQTTSAWLGSHSATSSWPDGRARRPEGAGALQLVRQAESSPHVALGASAPRTLEISWRRAR
jgi:hypothetical protein